MDTTRAGFAKRTVLWVILALWTFALMEASAAVYFVFFSRTYYRPLYLEQRDDQWLWRTEYEDWGSWHQPSSTAHHRHHCFSVTYTSNSYGARDRERTIATSAKRVVLLGDSFIEGYGVDEGKRLSNLLEQAVGVEVLNFGATHFGPLQYQILYERLARYFDHDLVVIGLLPSNDFVDNDLDSNRKIPSFSQHYRPYYTNTGTPFYPRPRPDPSWRPFARSADLAQNRTWHVNLRHMFWLYGLRREITTNVMVLAALKEGHGLGYLEDDPVRIAHVVGSIRAIQQLAAPRPVLVAFLPDYKSWSDIEGHPGSYEDTVAVKMGKVLEDHGIMTVDLLKKFMDRGLDRNALYLPCDGHWNGSGNAAAAQVLGPIVGDLLKRSSRSTESASVRQP